MKKRTVAIKIDLFEVFSFLIWMRETAGIPFLAKLGHQNLWTPSKNACRFFMRFPEQIPNKADQENARRKIVKPVKLHIMCRRSDWMTIELYIRLRWPTIKVGSVKKRNTPKPVAWKYGKVLAA